MKIFGMDLFKKKGLMLHESAMKANKESEFLVDFYRDIGSQGNSIEGAISGWNIEATSTGLIATQPTTLGKKGKKKIEIKKPKVEEKKLTPKDVFKLELLNNKSFEMKTDPKYIDEHIEDFKTRLNIVNAEDYDMRRGLVEIQSILMRFENRKSYGKYSEFFKQYPYTTSSKIGEVTKKHDHLKLGQIAQFVADLPKEAIDVMKKYTDTTKELCDKKPVFYIIADKKDFQKTDKRRDPILLAQSPFGHFWQILGAWDSEMLLIEEL